MVVVDPDEVTRFDGLLDALGVNDIIPDPVKSLTDDIFHAEEKLVLHAGHKTAEVLRKLE